MVDDDRPYAYGKEGRLDCDGTVWYACDPYPTWFRWEGKKLIRPHEVNFPGWADGLDDFSREEEKCPNCGAKIRTKELWEGGGVECNDKCGYWFCY